MIEKDKLPSFSNYQLQWCLKELDKEEFRTFKKILKEKYSKLIMSSIPWTEVDNANVECLGSFLHEYYTGPLVWAISINIFEEMNLLMLSEIAKDVMKKCPLPQTPEDSEPIKTVQGPKTSQAAEHNAAAETYEQGDPGDYKAHVMTRFAMKLDAHHGFVTTADDWPGMQTLIGAFNPDQRGFQTRTVVLHGKPGIGKSALARRIMLSWAQGKLYRDMFSYVIFLYAREMKWTEESSFADLIAREWPNSQAPMTEIMSQPERLLFVVDGFDDPCFTLGDDDTRLCGDWAREQPTSILMHSLLKKVLLPESFLIITARDTSIEKLESVLVSPLYLLVGGMSVARRIQMLLEHITDDHRRTQVLELVMDNRELINRCEVPSVCSLVRKALHVQEVLGRSSTPAWQTLTGLYATFVFHQLTPRDPAWRCLNQEEKVALKGLCQMAVERVWNMRSVFSRDDLSSHGLKESDLSALFHMDILCQDMHGERSYTFFHLGLQEFFAALYYVLMGLEIQGHCLPLRKIVRNVTELKHTGYNSHLLWLKRFLFGLMNKDVVRALEVLLGSPLRLVARQTLLQCASLLGQKIGITAPVDVLEYFYYLFETQDEEFVRFALKGFQEVRLPINGRMDLKVSSFCLQHCQGLQKLQVDVKDISRDELAQQCPMFPHRMQHKALADEWWENFCSVLSASPNLQQLDLGSSVLDERAMRTLCTKLSHPACNIQRLTFQRAHIASGLRYLWRVLFTNRNLRYLNLGLTHLREEDVRKACEALRHPNCALETLRLDSCGLTHTCYPVISQLLNIPIKLESLSLARNMVTDQGMNPLCDALKTSQCTLKRLILDNCGLTAVGCQVLASALNSNRSLTHLCLSNNSLGTDGMSQLWKSLSLPDCTLQWLILNQCKLDMTACGFLALALIKNRQLTHLSLSMNPLEDSGMKLLCEVMRDPSCHLQDLELVNCRLTEACCKNLAHVIQTNKYLRSLDLAANALGDTGVAELCEGLKQRDSFLSRLGLEACGLTSDCCETLSSALSCNQHLTSINLLRNNFSPVGVKQLCSAFVHPTSNLRIIGLWKVQYPAEVQEQLEKVQLVKPHLVIDGNWYSFNKDDRYWWKN